MEIFKDIPEFKDYQASDWGRIKSLKFGKERILKSSIDRGGYSTVGSLRNGKQINYTVHQLIAMAFLNHKPNGHRLVVNHINFDKTDNRLENLEIISHRENCNRKHIKSSSKYVGVGWHKNSKKWIARIRVDGKLKYLGNFKNERVASRAYNRALKRLNGRQYVMVM